MARLLEYLLELIFFLIVGKLLSATFRNFFGASTFRVPGSRNPAAATEPKETVRGETARDPVCGMFVSTELSHQLKTGGHTLHFCSEECLERYKKNPIREVVER